MNSLFLILFLASFACLIIGLIKPIVFKRIPIKNINRSKIGMIFGSAAVLTIILFGVTINRVEVKEIKDNQTIAFEKKSQDEPALEKGQTKIIQSGKNGSKELTYKVTYTDGKETNRELKSEQINEQAKPEITGIGTKVVVAAAPPTPPPPAPKPLTPAENVAASARNQLGDRFVSAEFDPASGTATITFKANELWSSGSTLEQTDKETVDTAKRIYGDEGGAIYIRFHITGSTKDAYGNSGENEEVLEIHLSREIAGKINPSGMDWDKFKIIADYYKEKVNF